MWTNIFPQTAYAVGCFQFAIYLKMIFTLVIVKLSPSSLLFYLAIFFSFFLSRYNSKIKGKHLPTCKFTNRVTFFSHSGEKQIIRDEDFNKRPSQYL